MRLGWPCLYTNNFPDDITSERYRLSVQKSVLEANFVTKHSSASCVPAIFFCKSVLRLQWQEAKQANRDVPLHGKAFQLLLGDPGTFPGQIYPKVLGLQQGLFTV